MPVVQCILDNLPLISCLSLLRTFPINVSGYDLAMKRTEEYMRIFCGGIHCSFFSNELNECSITGEFLLSVLIGVPWWNNDGQKAVIETTTDLTPTEMLKYVSDDVVLKSCHSYPKCEHIENVIDFRVLDNNNRKVQLITLASTIEEHINCFYVPMCMNYITKNKLVIKNPESILKSILDGFTIKSL